MLKNLQIRSKLVAILVLPLLALALLASNQAISRISASVAADRLARITQFGAVSLTDLTDALQRERAVTNWYVASGHRRSFGTMIADRVLVNEAAHALEASVRQVDLNDYGPQLQADLASARQQLGELLSPGGQRARLENAASTVTDVSHVYDPLIAKLIDAISTIGDEDSTGRPLARNLAAFVALARAKEASSQAQSLLLGVLTRGLFSSGQYPQLAALDGRRDAWLEQYRGAATARQRRLYDQTVAGRDIERVDRIEQRLLAARDVPEDLTPQQWFFPTSARADLLHQFELGLKDDVLAAATSSSSEARRQATVVTAAMALVLTLGIGLSLLQARSMARPLLVLERAALKVADEQLPGVVERLQDAAEDIDLAEVTRAASAPVPIRSRDEIGRLAEAFNAVHQVAVRVAVEQAALRRSIGDMFLNLARRSQVLVDRQLELIDELEREADDDSLEQLFRLDHLATRMRRNAENLIVLSGGAVAGHRLTQPARLLDVVRGAMSEVEDYQRVELLPIDEVAVTGHAVADVVHLLAELIENATSFSPPGTQVQIAGQRAAGGYVLEIEDRGLGMSDEELLEANERLANPPTIDFAVARVLGLYVIGRLAQRHGIKVQLRHSWYGGVTALALLPSSLLSGPQAEWRPSGGAPQLAPPEAGQDLPADDLPVPARVLSDWFETASPGGAHLPLRRHAPQGTRQRAHPAPLITEEATAPVPIRSRDEIGR
ncbi:MAG TPA: nitrate- and nitrite sensing domain-containing protein, partial [Actinomycetes bacterium]|nr:nitrate- and nitrite sensing domain-containing protein [Actinomycetes bacterium]